MPANRRKRRRTDFTLTKYMKELWIFITNRNHQLTGIGGLNDSPGCTERKEEYHLYSAQGINR